MGLDQYITIRHNSTNDAYTKFNNYWKLSEEERAGKREPKDPAKDLIIGYFRKHHSIHKWFVNNIQNGVDDCGRYEIQLKDIENLKELCEEILSHVTKEKREPKFYTDFNGVQHEVWQLDNYIVDEEGKNIIDEKLPSYDMDYSDDYFYCVENCIEVLNKVIDFCDGNFFRLYTDRATGEYEGDWVLEYVSSW